MCVLVRVDVNVFFTTGRGGRANIEPGGHGAELGDAGVLALVGIALVLKGVAAAVLLKSTAWVLWLEPGTSLGVAAGAISPASSPRLLR